jgi:hypothetical protein
MPRPIRLMGQLGSSHLSCSARRLRALGDWLPSYRRPLRRTDRRPSALRPPAHPQPRSFQVQPHGREKTRPDLEYAPYRARNITWRRRRRTTSRNAASAESFCGRANRATWELDSGHRQAEGLHRCVPGRAVQRAAQACLVAARHRGGGYIEGSQGSQGSPHELTCRARVACLPHHRSVRPLLTTR